MTASPGPRSVPIFIAEVEAFGGAERSLLALSRWLAENDHANHILTYRDAIGLSSFATHPLEIVELRPSGGMRAKVSALRRALRSGSPKPIVSGYQPALHCTLAGVRGFHTLLHDTPSLFGDAPTRSTSQRLRIAISNRIIGHGLRSGGVTTVNSEYLRRECRREFGAEASIVRMGGLRPSRPTQARRVEGSLRMLSVCRIEPNKRIDWLLRALERIARSGTLASVADWRLDIVGEGSERPALTAMAKALGLDRQVFFHGFVDDAALEHFYDAAHLFLMPAVQGYGIPALEAIGRGMPVLLHRESGVSDILLDTPWATVMHGGEEEMAPALARAIDSVLHCLHCDVSPPTIPTEESWAESVATRFGYPKR